MGSGIFLYFLKIEVELKKVLVVEGGLLIVIEFGFLVLMYIWCLGIELWLKMLMVFLVVEILIWEIRVV